MKKPQKSTTKLDRKFAWTSNTIAPTQTSIPAQYPYCVLYQELLDESSFSFDKIHISYFNNPQQVAKDFKKTLQFFSSKDEPLQNKIFDIKHTNLLHYCSQILGYATYEEYRKNHTSDIAIDKYIVKSKLKEFLTKKLKISDSKKHTEYIYFFITWVFVQDIYKELSNIKLKMKYRLDKIEEYVNWALAQKDKPDLIMDMLHEKEKIAIYRETLSARYRYVWSIDYLQDFLEYNNVYHIQFFQDLLCFLPKLCVYQNIYNFIHSEAEETYYITKENYSYIEELLFASVISKQYHCGLDMSGAQQKISQMRIAFLQQKYGLTAHKIFFNFYRDEYSVYLTDYLEPILIIILADSIIFKQGKIYFFIDYDTADYRLILNVRIAKNIVSSRNFKNFYPKTLNDELILYLKGEENPENCLKIGLNYVSIRENNKEIKYSYQDILKKIAQEGIDLSLT